MPGARPSGPAGASAPAYTLLVIGRLGLVVERTHIITLESLFDLDEHPGPGGVAPLNDLAKAGEPERGDLPVYCLDEALNVLDTVADTLKVCVIMSDGQTRFGLLCERIRMLGGDEIREHALPECMHLPFSPVVGLMEYPAPTGATLACHVTPHGLYRYICEFSKTVEGNSPLAAPA